MTQMLKHATEKPAPLASFAPDLPPALQMVADKLLAKVPDQRYATPAQAAGALKPFLGATGAAPAPAAMIPAYKEWLETESQLELTLKLPPPPAAPAKPEVSPAPTAPRSGSGGVPASTPRPAAPAVKPGTAPAPALAPAKPTSPSTNTPRPVPRPGPARPIAPVEEVDVELVADPGAPVLIPAPAGEPLVKYVKVKDNRTLLEFDRRDWIMLASGATGVLVAVGLGYGLARLLRKKPEEPPPEE